MYSKKLLQLGGLTAAMVAVYAYAANPSAVGPGHAANASSLLALPNAKPGECYAKVAIPAQYRTEMVKVVAQEASTRFESIPAQYEMVEQNILVKEAATEIIPVAPIYETVQKTVELEPEQRTWVLGRSYNAKAANDALLAAIVESGVKLNELPAGSCLREYYVPAQYRTEQIKVLKTPGYENVEVEPAHYDWVEEKVLVKEKSTQVVEIPAVYESVTEQVLVAPASTQWKAGSGPYQKIDNNTGEIMCLVEVPAQYKTVTRRVLKTQATTQEMEVPAEYLIQRVRKLVKPAQERRIKVEPTYQVLNKEVQVAEEQYLWQADFDPRPADSRPTGQTVCLQVTPAKLATVDQYQITVPATTRTLEIPAEYRTLKVRKLVTPAQTRKFEVPAVVETVAKQIKVSDERTEWRKVLCETNITPGIVSNLQNALMKAGYNPGTVDGRINTRTLQAVDEYQRSNGLERGGLTLSTLKALGVGI